MKQVKIILFLLLFATGTQSFSQGNTSITRIPRNYKTFQVGLLGSLDMCFRTLENKEREASIDGLITTKNNEETLKFGYHTGIGFTINVTEHFGVELGIVYSNRGYETNMKDYIYPSPNPSLPTQGRSIYNYNFIDVPFRFNFYAGKGKVRFYGSFGIITNVLVGQNETFVSKFADGRKEYTVYDTNSPFEKVVFSGTLSAGIDCKFNKFISLRISPNFTHTFGRFSDNPLSEYLWTAGFGASIYYGWY